LANDVDADRRPGAAPHGTNPAPLSKDARNPAPQVTLHQGQQTRRTTTASMTADQAQHLGIDDSTTTAPPQHRAMADPLADLHDNPAEVNCYAPLNNNPLI